MLPRFCLILMLGPLLVPASGCGRTADGKAAVRNEGSDTMVNVAEAWAEQYHKEHPNVSVQVLGGGSGVGIASLIDGNCDMANTSRKMKKDEIEAARNKRGAEPKEIRRRLRCLGDLRPQAKPLGLHLAGGTGRPLRRSKAIPRVGRNSACRKARWGPTK